ncbi:Ig-like domain-containing protein [Pseudomonas gingeri]
MLFDGAVAATVATAADSHPTADAAKAPTADQAPASKDTHAQADATPTPAPAAVPGQTVVFVDSRVKDFDSLLKGIAPGTQVVMLDGSKDGLQQIADYLDTHQGVSSVQLIAHGNAGDLWLGNTYLSADNVAARADVLAEIGKDMNAGGDILIYACYTAEGQRGVSFVDSLAELTGRDVAASTNRTGVGGDWTLEIATGSIESVNVLSQQSMSAYQWGLATWTATNGNDSGVGSLRAALASSQNGDIVTFNSAMTVVLNSQLVVTKNITLDGDLNNDGAADVTLDGQYRTSVIQVNSGTTVTFDGLVITRGLIAGNGGNGGSGTSAANSLGAGISNFGDLTLKNVSVTANAASGGGGGGGVTGGAVGGAGGGGGALGNGIGGHGGSTGSGTGNYAGSAGSANQGGTGGGYNLVVMGGKGGSGSAGAGSTNPYGYSNGSAGGAAAVGGISIGGGGGGAGWNAIGGKGGGAAGGIYNATGAKLTIVGNSAITGNIGAGGGGGGGGSLNSGSTANGGDGGLGVGAIWNKGTVLITAANFASLGGSANSGASGNGGLASAGTAGNKPTAVNGLFNDVGGTSDNAYVPAPTATIVVATPAQHIGSTSQVTITFSEAVNGFTLADLTVANGSLSNLLTSDSGKTWTATFTPDANVASSSGQIILDNTGVTSQSLGLAGIGTTASNSYTVDTARPTATIQVDSPALNVGGSSQVHITFSEAVSGFSLSDMTASNGTLSNLTTSDNIHWTATLTPTAGNNSAGNVITLDNTLYTDGATNAGTGSSTSNTYVVDTVRPTATIAVTNTTLNIAGNTSLVTITFSEAVTGLTTAAFTVADGALSGLSSSDGGITWTATLTATAGVTHTGDVITLNNTVVSDGAGNAGSGSTNSNTYAVDTQRPTASIVFGNTNLGIGQTSPVTITFSEAVTGFTLADLTVTNGVLSNLTTSDNITWTATFTPTAAIVSASNHITLDNTGVADTAGNAGSGSSTSNNVAIDGVRPTATVVIANDSLKIGDTSLVTITFSEAVVGFSNADLTIANGTLSAVSSLDGGITWTATFTPSASTTDTTNLITLDNTAYSDTSGNIGTGSTVSNNYSIDTQRPTATIVVADPVLTAGETSLVTITFSEAVTGFTLADLSTSHGSLSGLSSADGITWTATFTPGTNTNSATNAITLANTGIADLAGNAGTGSTNSANFTIDTVLPTASIVMANPALNIGGTSLVTITFNEAVTGFSNADLTITNGTLSAVSTNDGGITWTATFTPSTNLTDATNQITLDNSGVQAVVSGNVGIGSSASNNFAIDTQRPTATVVVTTDHLGIGGTSVVTITFSEAVTGLSLADLTTDNGTLSNLSTSDNITYTATLTPVAGITQNNNHIVLDNTGVVDIAGNSGSGTSESNSYAIDSQRPTATIVIADPVLTAGETSQVTITFSEAVTGFDNSDLTVPNGTLSALTSSDGGITWTATFTPTSNINDTTNLISLNNAGYTDLAGNAGAGSTSSANFTIDTVRPTATIVVADNALKVGETSTVTITFSEAVSGFDATDLSVASGTLSNLTSGDGGITWTATLTPTSNITDTSNVIVLNNSGVANASGNTGLGTTSSNNYSVDTQSPTATISVANDHIGIGQTTTVTITFSEVVSGFDLSDLSVANGTLSNLASSDGGKTWTATLTPTVGVTDATNLIVLDTSLVSDGAGNTGAGIAISNNFGVDADLPTATIVVANPNLTAGQTTTVTFTFSEKVTGFDLSDLSVANGVLSNLASSDGGKTWTATLTPTANITDPSNFITLDTSLVTDLAGNAGTGYANSNNYGITTVSLGGDPQFRITDPAPPPDLPNVPLQPVVFGPPNGNLGSPIGFPPLFEQRDVGGGLPPIGNIFIRNGALAPSFIAQVFSTDSGGDGSGSGFLGFGGGDGGVFGSSTLSGLFNRESNSDSAGFKAFERQGSKSLGDPSQGLRGIFGAPTLGQQLQQLKDSEQKQLHELAWALEQVGVSEMSA